MKVRLRHPAPTAKGPHRQSRLLPGGDGFSPELLATRIPATMLRHDGDLLAHENATNLPGPRRRAWSGRLLGISPRPFAFAATPANWHSCGQRRSARPMNEKPACDGDCFWDIARQIVRGAAVAVT